MNPTLTTLTGRTIDMLYPESRDIVLADIARGLATQIRFCGHIRSYHYSVAEHSLNVSALLRDGGASLELRRAGLLHDAAEAYVGDLIGPAKAALRVISGGESAFDRLEAGFARAIGVRFGVCLEPLPHTVKAADVEQLFHEDRDLRSIPLPRGISPRSPVRCLRPELAESLFLEACEELDIR